MENSGDLPFPYKFVEVTPEEKSDLDQVFNFWNFLISRRHFTFLAALTCYRVGPKGYILFKPYKKYADAIYNMLLRPTDVFVAGLMRSGTTWTQALVWLIANNLDYAEAERNYLKERYAFLDRFNLYNKEMKQTFLDSIKERDSEITPEMLAAQYDVMSEPVVFKLATAASPRFIRTHLPMSFLPPKLLDIAKVVYVARDPRDVAVSCFHFIRLYKTNQTVQGVKGEFKVFWNMFYKNLFMYTPVFAHIKEAWGKRNHPNMLFLFYEELSQDMPSAIKRVATFFGKELSKEQQEGLMEYLQIDNFRKNKFMNFSELKRFGVLDSKENFIRKGKTAGWHDYFDEEMAQQAEQWIDDNLRGTDLIFPSMSNKNAE